MVVSDNKFVSATVRNILFNGWGKFVGAVCFHLYALNRRLQKDFLKGFSRRTTFNTERIIFYPCTKLSADRKHFFKV